MLSELTPKGDKMTYVVRKQMLGSSSRTDEDPFASSNGNSRWVWDIQLATKFATTADAQSCIVQYATYDLLMDHERMYIEEVRNKHDGTWYSI